MTETRGGCGRSPEELQESASIAGFCFLGMIAILIVAMLVGAR
jgi:hypothetical protein